MASPRVFVSSTCYDLGEVRDALVDFVRGFGFEAVLSEKGDVFFHPDLHTHESCVKEVTNCHLFILIIGGRFGGSYVSDPKKSIVNAEYEAARILQCPVFTFVKRDVWEDHRVFQKNKDANGEVVYPAIDKQENARKIFEFIDQVRKSSVNNGTFKFEFSRDIEETLRKQWAGLLFDFLTQRKAAKDYSEALTAITSLSSVSSKIEDLVKKLYLSVEPKNAPDEIQKTENEIEAKEFFSAALKRFELEFFVASDVDKAIAAVKKCDSWVDYIMQFDGFRRSEGVYVGGTAGKTCSTIGHRNTPYIYIVDGYLDKNSQATYNQMEKQYGHLRNLPANTIADIVKTFVKVKK